MLLRHQAAISLIDTVRALEASKEQARARHVELGLTPGCDDAVVVRDVMGRIAFWSQAAARLYGYQPAEALGAYEDELLASPWPEAALESLLAQGSWCGELVQRHAAGQAVIVSTEWALHVDGKSAWVVAHYRDVTDCKRLEQALRESERRSRTVFDNTFEFIGLLDLDGTLLEANQTALRAAGVPRDEVVGRPFWDAPWWNHSPELQEQLRSGVQEAARGQLVRFEAQHPTPEGDLFWVDVTIKPFFDADGKVVWLIPEGHDITERKRLEDALEEQFRQLQDLDRLKAAFVSAVSHELRTPLSSIKGYAEFLEDEIGGPLNDQQMEFVRHLERSVRRLEYLVDDLLDLTRIEAGSFRLALVEADLAERVRQDVDALYPQAQEARLHLQVDLPTGPLLLTMDSQRIGQVLTNLLQNAIKFTPPGGQILVRVEREPQGVRCLVKDSGIGIAAEDRPKLFQRFTQLENGRERGVGTGLGLSICKTIIEGHGGEIGVESSLGAGSTFWFTLPYLPPVD